MMMSPKGRRPETGRRRANHDKGAMKKGVAQSQSAWQRGRVRCEADDLGVFPR